MEVRAAIQHDFVARHHPDISLDEIRDTRTGARHAGAKQGVSDGRQRRDNLVHLDFSIRARVRQPRIVSQRQVENRSHHCACRSVPPVRRGVDDHFVSHQYAESIMVESEQHIWADRVRAGLFALDGAFVERARDVSE